MPVSPDRFPLRVRHAGTDPVHAARSKTPGHVTVCWLWLDPGDPHIWCDEGTEVTCTKCIERMGPEPVKRNAPGTVGTLQERLAEVIDSQIPSQDFELARHRIAETVDGWRRDAEERIRLSLDRGLADLIPEANRSDAVRNLTQAVLRNLDVGNDIPSKREEG